MAKSPSLIRRLTLSVLLPLLLLFSQQGALLHELSHWHPAPHDVDMQVQAQSSADADICLECLGFAQVAGLAHFDLPALPGQDGLSYHFLALPSRSVAEAAPPALRSRGPPTVL